MPSPNKFSIYYPYIEENLERYKKPIFFELLGPNEKYYDYVNFKNILGEAIKVKKDIFFYENTHWSPIASKIIAQELVKRINPND